MKEIIFYLYNHTIIMCNFELYDFIVYEYAVVILTTYTSPSNNIKQYGRGVLNEKDFMESAKFSVI